MKGKIMNLPKAVVVLITFLLAVGFLMVLRGGSYIVAYVPTEGYMASLVGEVIVSIYALILLLVFGYGRIVKEKGVGFVKGFYVAGFFLGYVGLEVMAMSMMMAIKKGGAIQPALYILFFVLTMFFIGWAEEIVFRGVILNLLLERFSNSRGGIIVATVISSVMFGALHLNNYFAGVKLESALVQAVQAMALGLVFSAVYVRTGNIWIGIIMHAAVDFVGLMSSGIFGIGTEIDGINNISAANLISLPIFLIPAIVLLRGSKLDEIVRRRNEEVVFETYAEAESAATTSLVVGIIGILAGCMGMGLGLGITGILGSSISMKIKKEGNGVAVGGMVTSIISIVISIFMGIILLITYASMDAAMLEMLNY